MRKQNSWVTDESHPLFHQKINLRAVLASANFCNVSETEKSHFICVTPAFALQQKKNPNRSHLFLWKNSAFLTNYTDSEWWAVKCCMPHVGFLQKINYLYLRWQEAFPYSSPFFQIKLKCTEHKTATVLSSLAKIPLPQRKRIGFKEINKLQRNQEPGCIINSQAALSEVTNRKLYLCRMWLFAYKGEKREREEGERREAC